MKKRISLQTERILDLDTTLDVFNDFIQRRRVENPNAPLSEQEKSFLESKLLGNDIDAAIATQTQHFDTRLGDRFFNFDAMRLFSSKHTHELDPSTLIVPQAIVDQLDQPCPFSANSQVKDTHRLVYFPGLSVSQLSSGLDYTLKYNQPKNKKYYLTERSIIKLSNETYIKHQDTCDAHSADRDFYTESSAPQWALVYDQLQAGSKDIDYFDYDGELETPQHYHSASAGEATYFQLVYLLKTKSSPFGSDLVGTNDEYGYDMGEPVVSVGISEGAVTIEGDDNKCKNPIGRMLVYKLDHQSAYWRG